MKQSVFVVLLMCAALVCVEYDCLAASRSGESCSGGVIDCEIHYCDFNQNTDGMEKLFQSMDDANVESACIMGIPLQKVWEEHAPQRPLAYESDDAPVYYYSVTDVLLARAVLQQPPVRRARLRPLLCGFNPVDRNAVNHVEQMLRLYPNLWSGIGEILTRHDNLSHLTYGEASRANSKALQPVYQLAAQHNLTVLLHSNITSVREGNLIYLEELKEALLANPKTRFAWAHAGTSANIERRQHLQNLHVTVERLLEQFPNLWIVISWTLTPAYLLDDAGKPRQEWIDLVTKYSDRFVIGSDIVGDFDKLSAALSEERAFLGALSPTVVKKVAHDNAEFLFPVVQ